MWLCVTVTLLASAAAWDRSKDRYAFMSPLQPFNATAFAGEWYAVWHEGKIQGCPKFNISFDTAANNIFINEFTRNDNVTSVEPLRSVTYRVTSNTAAEGLDIYKWGNPKMDLFKLRTTFLGGDKRFKRWAAFNQHFWTDVNGNQGSDWDQIIILARKPSLNKRRTFKKIKRAFGEVQVKARHHAFDKRLKSLKEIVCDECWNPTPNKNFIAEKFDGVWYPQLHHGQVPGCPQFNVSHNSEQRTRTIKEFVGNSASGRELTLKITGANVAVGPDMYTEGTSVTSVFLGSDDYQSWAAFYQCVQRESDGAHMFHHFLVLSRQPTLSEANRKEAQHEVLEVTEQYCHWDFGDIFKITFALNKQRCGNSSQRIW